MSPLPGGGIFLLVWFCCLVCGLGFVSVSLMLFHCFSTYARASLDGVWFISNIGLQRFLVRELVWNFCEIIVLGFLEPFFVFGLLPTKAEFAQGPEILVKRLLALALFAFGWKLRSLLFLFCFFFSFHFFPLGILSIFCFTFRYTRHKYQLQINNKAYILKTYSILLIKNSILSVNRLLYFILLN